MVKGGKVVVRDAGQYNYIPYRCGSVLFLEKQKQEQEQKHSMTD